MSGAGDSAIIERWKELAGAEPDSRRRADYGGLALVFAELAGVHSIWKHELEGWNVVESPQVLEWQQQALKDGREKEREEAILRVLKHRFDGNVTDDLVAAIEAIDDFDELGRLFDCALTADSIVDFRQQSRLN